MTESDAIKRVHITGAACSGVTTLGRRVAEALGVRHVDTDDSFWLPTDPPFTEKRPIRERIALIRAAQGSNGWVISGSLDGWGDPLVENADVVVFLDAPTTLRLARLKRRERERFGARIGPGGDMEAIHASFLIWASQYDDPGFIGRSRSRHEAWLSERETPVLRLSGTRAPEALTGAVLAALGQVVPG